MQTPSSGSALPPDAARRRRLISALGVVIGLCLLAGCAWWLLQREPSHAGFGFGRGGRHGPPTTIGVATASASNLPVTIEALGTVKPAATVIVRPQVSGVIEKITFREGQMVKKGELLAQIDPRPFANALQQAQGALKRDQAQLADAKLQLERYRTLIAQDSIAQQEVDTQAASVQQLEGTIAADRAAVASARLDLDYARITAPIAGRVGLRVIDAGNYISAGDANGIAVITGVTPIDVEFSVPQDRAGEIQTLAAHGTLTAIALDRTRTHTLASGQFLTLDNQVDTSTGTVRAKARFTNTDGALFPSQFVNLRLQLRTLHGAIVVPLSAVRNGANGDFVYLVNADHTVSVRTVTRGQQSDDRVQIATGLALGERVVTEGGDRLSDGASVQLPDDAKPAADAAGRDPATTGQKRADAGQHPRRKPSSAGNTPPPGH